MNMKIWRKLGVGETLEESPMLFKCQLSKNPMKIDKTYYIGFTQNEIIRFTVPVSRNSRTTPSRRSRVSSPTSSKSESSGSTIPCSRK